MEWDVGIAECGNMTRLVSRFAEILFRISSGALYTLCVDVIPCCACWGDVRRYCSQYVPYRHRHEGCRRLHGA